MSVSATIATTKFFMLLEYHLETRVSLYKLQFLGC